LKASEEDLHFGWFVQCMIFMMWCILHSIPV
jgi:hypothetical protein